MMTLIHRNRPTRLIALASIFIIATAARADESVVNSVHNLSATGPGNIRATNES